MAFNLDAPPFTGQINQNAPPMAYPMAPPAALPSLASFSRRPGAHQNYQASERLAEIIRYSKQSIDAQEAKRIVTENGDMKSDEYGRLPFFYAADPDALLILLEETENPFRTDAEKNTFLHFIMLYRIHLKNWLSLAKTYLSFIKNKQYPNRTTNTNTQFTEFINAKNKNGFTMMHLAALFMKDEKDANFNKVSMKDIDELLTLYPFDLTIKNNQGKYPEELVTVLYPEK